MLRLPPVPEVFDGFEQCINNIHRIDLPTVKSPIQSV